MDTNTHTKTQKRKIHFCEKKKRNICRDQSLSRTIYSNWTFTDTNPGVKKNHNPIKTVTTIKTKGNTQINHLFPEDETKRQKTPCEEE